MFIWLFTDIYSSPTPKDNLFRRVSSKQKNKELFVFLKSHNFFLSGTPYMSYSGTVEVQNPLKLFKMLNYPVVVEIFHSELQKFSVDHEFLRENS